MDVRVIPAQCYDLIKCYSCLNERKMDSLKRNRHVIQLLVGNT